MRAALAPHATPIASHRPRIDATIALRHHMTRFYPVAALRIAALVAAIVIALAT